MMYFDQLLYLLPALIFSMWAQAKVKSAYAAGMRLGVSSGLSGAQAAERILRSAGLHDVGIEATRGFLGDHYDPRHKVLRLSPQVYSGRSVAAVGIAAHEAGHAIQDAAGYTPLVLRNGIVPLASIGSNMSWILLLIGFLLGNMHLVIAGIVLFSMVVLFQLINLPVEYNASSRAREILLTTGIITPVEQSQVSKVLSAAALTYVAATLTAVLNLLYFLMRAGLLGGRDE